MVLAAWYVIRTFTLFIHSFIRCPSSQSSHATAQGDGGVKFGGACSEACADIAGNRLFVGDGSDLCADACDIDTVKRVEAVHNRS